METHTLSRDLPVHSTWVLDPAHESRLSKHMDNASLTAMIGGKAASLWQLGEWGVQVPGYCCITTAGLIETLRVNQLHSLIDWVQQPTQPLPLPFATIRQRIMNCRIPEAISTAILRFIDAHPESTFAVRSSGTLEDSKHASFAGLFETVLNVKTTTDIHSAVKACWLAFFDDRVLTYLKEKNIQSPMGLAIILQTLIPAEKSGVLFTVDPVRGQDKNMLVEACFGLGEALVSGHVTPDQYRYNWFDEKETDRFIADKTVFCERLDTAPFTRLSPLDNNKSKTAVLSEEELKTLCMLSLSIQEASGFPVDIEWAKTGEQFYILQSRPITQLGYAGIPGEWTTADFRDGGVSSTICTPFMASLYKSVMDTAMADYLKGLGLTPRKEKDIWQLSFYGRPYWNLEAVKYYLSQIPQFNERAFDEGLGIAPNYEGQGIVSKLTPRTLLTGLKALWTIKSNCRKKLRQNPAFAARQKLRLQAINQIDLHKLDDASLFKHCREFLEVDYFQSEYAYFDFIYDNANLNTLFKDRVDKLNVNANDFPLLLSGLSSVSHLSQIEDLWLLRAAIIQSPANKDFWLDTTTEAIVSRYRSNTTAYCLDQFKAFINKHGHHAKRELDLMAPRYAEDPAYVIDQLKDILRQPDSHDPKQRNKHQQKKSEKAQQALLQSVPFWSRRSLASQLRQIRRFLWWREELRDLSTQFYFHVRKIILEVEQRLLTKGLLENAGDIFFLEQHDLIQAMAGNLSIQNIQQQVKKNRSYYRSFANFTIPDELGQRYSGGTLALATTNHSNQWVAGSPGVATGTARVIANIDEAKRLQTGDILVTRCTDPAWTACFSTLSGVVTETGGILSHAAVICREYGMPAVLAVKQATELIQDGETITLDGNNGQILIHDGDTSLPLSSRHPSDSDFTEGAAA